MGVGSGIMMEEVLRRRTPSEILFLVRNTLLREGLSMKTNLPVGVIVLEDFWLLQQSIVAQIYFVLQF